MDPTLAARFARQKEKLEKAENEDVVEDLHVGSQAKDTKQLDPVLAQRWEKLQAGKAAITDDIGSVADKSTKLDPVLAKRWSKLEGGIEVEAMDQIGSVADKSTKLDPQLAERWAVTQERELTGKNAIEQEIGSNAENSRSKSELAKRFAKLQKPRGPEAERVQLSLRAGQSMDHHVPCAPGCSRLQWSAVALENLDIELEIVALLREPGSEGAPEELVLQRRARGETHVSAFYPIRDRRVATSGANGSCKEVEALIFKFSNSFSWFRGKQVELVILQECAQQEAN